MAARPPGDDRCKDCPEPREPGRSRCEACALRRRDEERTQREIRREKGKCLTCGRPAKRAKGRIWRYCAEHLEYYAARAARAAALGILLFLTACGARTGTGEAISDGPEDASAGGSGGAPIVLGAGGSVHPAGGAPAGSGGRVGAGGAPGAGGLVVGAGGILGAGGARPAAGGALGSGGAIGAGGASTDDAGVDAGPNYCDPAVQCAAPPSCNQPAALCPGRKCAGIWDCGHGQEIDCTLYVSCAADEFCGVATPPSPSFCFKR